MTENVTFNVDNVTGAQAVFLGDKTGRTLKELMALFESQDYTARDALAMAAIAINPDDPEVAWADLMAANVNAIMDKIVLPSAG